MKDKLLEEAGDRHLHIAKETKSDRKNDCDEEVVGKIDNVKKNNMGN